LQEFDFDIGVDAIENEDNKDIIQIIRENATRLAKYSVPKLVRWKSQLTEAITILSQWITDKTKDDRLLSNNLVEPSDEMTIVRAHSVMSQFNHSLTQMNIAIDQIKELLTGRCKDLFVKKV
jgi:hypothetical protein